ncbi:hypothetical protein DES44_1572 [Roseateles depolymerans]|nr:hypothetical protein DES44_1572 [Roseateles depolymerans]
MKEIPTANGADLSFGDDQTCLCQGNPFTGVAVFYRASGTRESEVEYLDGIQQGLMRDWNEFGVLVLEAEVRNGAYHGLVRYFSDHGQPLREEDYEFGICTARRVHDEGGAVRETFSIAPTDSGFRVLQAMRKAVE